MVFVGTSGWIYRRDRIVRKNVWEVVFARDALSVMDNTYSMDIFTLLRQT